MNLRKANLDHLSELTDLSRSTFVATFAHLNDPTDFELYVAEAFSEERILEELNTAYSAFYFVENQDVTVGYFKLNFNKSPAISDRPVLDKTVFEPYQNAPMTELERIYLKTAFQGQGVAQPIMAAIEQIAKEQGSRALWLGVWEENPKAVRFYEKSGFIQFGEHVFQIGNDAQRDFLMIKWL